MSHLRELCRQAESMRAASRWGMTAAQSREYDRLRARAQRIVDEIYRDAVDQWSMALNVFQAYFPQ